MIDKMLIRGAKVHNLKNIDVDIPLGKIVGIAGVSGSGKSSLALGVLYAEGSRRYLEALSTYTRRRMTQASKASVDEVLYVPAALALHQRPGVPGIRSTFGTGTELLNSLRLMYSRLASHRCPNGHYLAPSLAVAAGKELICPECGAHFYAPSAEELAFNSQGACKTCGGTGSVRTVDMASLVPDDTLSIDEGAVAPWNSLMWSLMTDVCREMGVRTDVPFRDLTAEEKEIVYHGPAVKKHILYKAKNSNQAGELDFTYYNAIYTVENALAKVKDEKGMKRVEKFLKEDICPECHGTRLSDAARAPKLRGISLDEACTMTLSGLAEWVRGVPGSLPEEMRPMAESICEAFLGTAKRLMDLGLGYLTLDRSASTLSTGERQRMQLARAVRNRTTGVLYVLDEPSIGLHPANIVGLTGVMHDLVADGNSLILVDHDTQILKEADWIIEMGPEAGAKGGHVIAEGKIPAIEANSASQIGAFLSGKAETRLRACAAEKELFANGTIHGELIDGVEADVKQIIEQICKEDQKHRTLYVILTTPGGSLNPVKRMVNIFRNFYTEVNFIVPDYAYSAGTVMCCSGDKIYMDYYSVLGPIDPQVMNKDGKFVAALGYLDKINELIKKAKNNELTNAEFIILKDFDLAELRAYEQARDLAIDLLVEWLPKYKFKNWIIHGSTKAPVAPEEKRARAMEIAQNLSDNKEWKSHGRPISRVELERLKLQIERLEENAEIYRAVTAYNELMVDYMQMFLCTICLPLKSIRSNR